MANGIRGEVDKDAVVLHPELKLRCFLENAQHHRAAGRQAFVFQARFGAANVGRVGKRDLAARGGALAFYTVGGDVFQLDRQG